MRKSKLESKFQRCQYCGEWFARLQTHVIARHPFKWSKNGNKK